MKNPPKDREEALRQMAKIREELGALEAKQKQLAKYILDHPEETIDAWKSQLGDS